MKQLQLIILISSLIITLITEVIGDTSGKDYYELLGLDKTASDREIRKAFRKLAMQYHPDRNKEEGAEKKFKEISEAYETLSDKGKRRQYDQFGHQTGSGGGGHRFNSDDFFNFGFGDDFGDDPFHFLFGGGGNEHQHQKAGGRSGRCKTTTIRVGDTITTYTQCL